ncbi:hypothetical protein MLD38_035281 [Melastoma candidum]|uniref:Uncharacterized protein n=1 Tax=Melastoma candidum TaxID=119954 RepID=A0ACB9MD66_9MYRT|nr:hypothetical protein MLD38_035281 [Melastoma candidum]
MEGGGHSFVSKARTAFHSAAAKAERVFSDIKSDLKHDRGDFDRESPVDSGKVSEDESAVDSGESKSYNASKNLRWKTPPITVGKKQDWQGKLRNIRIGKKGADDSEKVDGSRMSFPIYDENLYTLNEKADVEFKVPDLASILEGLIAGNTERIPTSSAVKRLAVAVENGKKFSSIKDILTSIRDSSPARERTGLSLSAVKSLVLREKDEKLEFADEERMSSLVCRLFEKEGSFLSRKTDSNSEAISTNTLPRDIHAVPPETFVAKLSEVIGSLRTMRDMALFWCKAVDELRRLWSEEQHISGIPPDLVPDLNCCLLYQQLQVINCCVSRKRRHSATVESLDSKIKEAEATSKAEESASQNYCYSCPDLYARLTTGEMVMRLGADHPCPDLTMLETGEPVYSPVTQEGPLLTEDLIRETEEFILRTGSVGAGCSQLLSDMQAFKAANPGCILEDFVRWHSPPDWTEAEEVPENENSPDQLSSKGRLSSRMQKEGNLWRELWDTSKPLPAVKQTPLFEEDLAVEGILDYFEDISPLELFEQLFRSLLTVGLVIAETSLSADENLSKLFSEYKDYVVTTCQAPTVADRVGDLCQVYETVEMMLLKPEDAQRLVKQQEESNSSGGEPRRLFKRLNFNFVNRDRSPKEQDPRNEKPKEDNPVRQSLSNFFDSKSSLFSKKPPKPCSSASSPAERPPICPDESDWTIV